LDHLDDAHTDDLNIDWLYVQDGWDNTKVDGSVADPVRVNETYSVAINHEIEWTDTIFHTDNRSNIQRTHECFQWARSYDAVWLFEADALVSPWGLRLLDVLQRDFPNHTVSIFNKASSFDPYALERYQYSATFLGNSWPMSLFEYIEPYWSRYIDYMREHPDFLYRTKHQSGSYEFDDDPPDLGIPDHCSMNWDVVLSNMYYEQCGRDKIRLGSSRMDVAGLDDVKPDTFEYERDGTISSFRSV
jgi:hypothetical protein